MSHQIHRSVWRLVPRTLRYYARANSQSAAPAQPPGAVVRVTRVPAPGTGHIRILELNRPLARNAISRALLDSLRREIDAVARQYGPENKEELPPSEPDSPTRALVVASAVDSCFCAGADLKERLSFTREE